MLKKRNDLGIKMASFTIIVSGQKPLSIISNLFMLDVSWGPSFAYENVHGKVFIKVRHSYFIKRESIAKGFLRISREHQMNSYYLY